MNNLRNAFLTVIIAAMALTAPVAQANPYYRPAPPPVHHHHAAACGIVPFAVGLGLGLLTAPFVAPPPPPPQVIVAPPPPPVVVVQQGRWIEREERTWVEGYWVESGDAYGRRIRTWNPGHWEIRRTRTWVE